MVHTIILKFKCALTVAGLSLLIVALTSCSTPSHDPRFKKSWHFSENIHAKDFLKGLVHLPPQTNFKENLKWYESHDFSFVAIPGNHQITTRSRSLIHLPTTIDSQSSIITLCSTLPNESRFRALLNTNQNITPKSPFEAHVVFDDSPNSASRGDDSHASAEEIWDEYMTQNHRIFNLVVSNNPTKSSEQTYATLVAWAPELSESALCAALRRGHFYSSHGSKITALFIHFDTMEVAVDKWNPSTDHVDFIGAGGKLLDRVTSMPARYRVNGSEGYVRAHIYQGEFKGTALRPQVKAEAWTQAYFAKYD